jgi:hypothetical protein
MNGYVDFFTKRKSYRDWVLRSSKTRDELISDNVSRNSRVLNYGCGYESLSFLTEKACSIVNYDIDSDNNKADYTDFGKIPGRFNVTVLREVIEHMTPGEISRAMVEIARISDSVIMTTPNVFDTASRIWFETDITHVRPYNTSDLEGILKRAGFSYVSAYVCEPIRSPRRAILSRLNTTLPYTDLVVVGKK